MELKYSSFISHKSGQGPVADRFLLDFQQALDAEIKMLKPYSSFLDQNRLMPGNLYNDRLAQELCRSACLIMIYTPRYFDAEATYCAREYKAMVDLEQRRFAEMAITNNPNGLIIPVILRGFQDLPGEIAGMRQVANFEGYSLGGRSLLNRPGEIRKIRAIAEYICARCVEIEQISSDLDCSNAELPTNEEITEWLQGMLSPQLPLPGRESLE